MYIARLTEMLSSFLPVKLPPVDLQSGSYQHSRLKLKLHCCCLLLGCSCPHQQRTSLHCSLPTGNYYQQLVSLEPLFDCCELFQHPLSLPQVQVGTAAADKSLDSGTDWRAPDADCTAVDNVGSLESRGGFPQRY